MKIKDVILEKNDLVPGGNDDGSRIGGDIRGGVLSPDLGGGIDAPGGAGRGRNEKFMGQAQQVPRTALPGPSSSASKGSGNAAGKVLKVAAPAAAAAVSSDAQAPGVDNPPDQAQAWRSYSQQQQQQSGTGTQRDSQAADQGTAKSKSAYKGSAGAQAIAQASGIKDVNKITPGQVLNLPGGGTYTVKKGDTLDAIASGKFKGKPTSQPEAPAPDQAAPAAADPSIDPYDPAKDPTLTGTLPTGSTDEIERMKKLAIGNANVTPPPEAPTQTAQAADAEPYGGAAARAMAAKSSPSSQADASSGPNVNALGVAQTANVPGLDGGTQSGQGTQARDASTVPDAARGVQTTPNVNPDTGLDATPKKVAGTSNVTTGSDDEMAWRSKNPNWQYLPPNQQYPGPGNWDPRTGRSKVAQAQADANAAAVKGFLNKINPFAKKEQPAQQQGQGTQASNTTTGPNPPGGGYGRFQESELDVIKKLSGL